MINTVARLRVLFKIKITKFPMIGILKKWQNIGINQSVIPDTIEGNVFLRLPRINKE